MTQKAETVDLKSEIEKAIPYVLQCLPEALRPKVEVKITRAFNGEESKSPPPTQNPSSPSKQPQQTTIQAFAHPKPNQKQKNDDMP
jgi:hypothetical protein